MLPVMRTNATKLPRGVAPNVRVRTTVADCTGHWPRRRRPRPCIIVLLAGTWTALASGTVIPGGESGFARLGRPSRPLRCDSPALAAGVRCVCQGCCLRISASRSCASIGLSSWAKQPWKAAMQIGAGRRSPISRPSRSVFAPGASRRRIHPPLSVNLQCGPDHVDAGRWRPCGIPELPGDVTDPGGAPARFLALTPFLALAFPLIATGAPRRNPAAIAALGPEIIACALRLLVF